MLKENIIKSQLKNLAKVFCIPKVDKFQKGFMGFDIFAWTPGVALKLLKTYMFASCIASNKLLKIVF